jgi:NAD(P)-dependent dehydrogenase (short-subunit alcohol dehydrogenase family)
MKTILITGASDGIGAASARQLRAKGHHVILVGRSPAKTEALARELAVPFYLADFTRLVEVRQLALALRALPRIDVLANNAGGIMGPRTVTEDGFEKTFQVNHLAPFLLTKLLMPQLTAGRATVIQTASIAANVFGSNFDVTDLNNERRYRADIAYGYAKLENILFTRELQRRHEADGVSAVAFHPGVVRSNFASETHHVMRWLYHTPLRYLFTISPESSGQRLTALAEGLPGTDWKPGEVYNKRRRMPLRFKDAEGQAARSLWEQSEAMVAPFCGPLAA